MLKVRLVTHTMCTVRIKYIETNKIVFTRYFSWFYCLAREKIPKFEKQQEKRGKIIEGTEGNKGKWIAQSENDGAKNGRREHMEIPTHTERRSQMVH